jgi:peptide/nickel transport system substrate-binding protein
MMRRIRLHACARGSGISAAALIAIGLSSPPLAQPAPAPRTEAPQLTEEVRSGRLPPLAQRMPVQPMVVAPHERIGRYGGTWRSALRGTADQSYLRRLVSYDSLVRWNEDATRIVPNLAHRFEVSADSTVYTFHLREGVRWSDGAPFTSADILFWFEARTARLVLNGSRPGIRTSRGDCRPEADGPFIVRFVCPEPFGTLLESIAGPTGDEMVAFPRHFMQQFHAAHAEPQRLASLVADARVQRWEDLFMRRGDPYMTPNKPTLAPWRLVQPYTGTQVVFERNPYYWKIDPEGQQLPYIDRVSFVVAQDNEVLLLNGLNGEFDFHARHFNTIANRAVVMENRARGRYEIVELDTTDANYLAIHLNMSHPDPARRALFQNRDLRVGLSHAINRAEIIDLVFLGAGTPWQAAPRREGPFFHERLATQYTEFSHARANAHFDRAGLRRGSDGTRLDPSGRPLRIRVTVRSDRTEMIETLQLVQQHWAAVGVALDLDVVERSLFMQRFRGNQHDAAADDVEGGGNDLLQLSDAYVVSDNTSYFGTGWYYWLAGRRDDPRLAIEPPEDVRRAAELFEQAGATADAERRAALIRQVLDIAADHFYAIGIAAPSDFYGIVATRMRNVPRRQIDSYSLAFPGPYAPEQFFFAAQ